jgi:hypothetical protein
MRSKSNENNNTVGQQPQILGTGLQGAMSNSLHNLSSFPNNRMNYR